MIGLCRGSAPLHPYLCTGGISEPLLCPCMRAVLAMASVPHTILGSALSLLLVFRTNSSYGRLVEGRRVRLRPAQP